MASHIKYLEIKHLPIPEPRTIEQIEAACKADNAFLVVPIAQLPVTTKAKRINIFINERLKELSRGEN